MRPESSSLGLALALALATGVVCPGPGRNQCSGHMLAETYYIEVPRQERTLAPSGDRGPSAVLIGNAAPERVGNSKPCHGQLFVGHG
jgi:hypothetical protein